MTFRVPNVDELGWGEPLQKHLAQLNDPEMGGLNVVQNDTERDSKFWPNGDSTKNDYVNKTIYNIATGGFQRWNVTLPNGPYLWVNLGRIKSSKLYNGPGVLKFTGLAATSSSPGYIYVDNDQGNLKDLVNVGDLLFSNGKTIRISDKKNGKLTVGYPKILSESEALSGAISFNQVEGTNSVTATTPTDWKVGDYVYRTGYAAFLIAEVINTQSFKTTDIAQYNAIVAAMSIFRVPEGQPYQIGEVIERILGPDDTVLGYKDYNNEEVQVGNTYLVSNPVTAEDIAANKTHLKSNFLHIGDSILLHGTGAVKTGSETTNLTLGMDLYARRGIGTFVSPEASSTPADWEGAPGGWTTGLRVICGHLDGLSPNSVTPNLSAIQTRSEIGSGVVSSYQHIYLYPMTGAGTVGTLWGIYENGNHFQTGKPTKNFFRGNVLIGSTNSPTAPHVTDADWESITEKLMVKGNITATGTITQGSDIRWKTDIEVISGALDKISKIKGVNFYWNDQEKPTRGEEIQIGLIAQDVEESGVKGAIKEDAEGFKRLNYNGLGALYVEAIKELHKKLEDKEYKIQQLEILLIEHTELIGKLQRQIDELQNK